MIRLSKKISNSAIAQVVLFLMLIMGNNIDVQAQCCSAGNPVGANGFNPESGKGELTLQTQFRHSVSKDYFHESEKIFENPIDRSYYDFSNIMLSYGISKRISAEAELGYFLDKAQELTIGDKDVKIKANGLGDLKLGVRYKLFTDSKNMLAISLGARFPIGAFEEEQDGVTIPISLQPSSGAYKINSSLIFSRLSESKLWGHVGIMYFEWSDEIEEGFLVYKYGNFFQVSYGAFYRPSPKLMIACTGKYEFRDQDKRENDQTIESTGGNVVYLNPMVRYSLPGKWMLSFSIDLPVYKYVNGYQLTNFMAYQIGVSKMLSVKK